MRRLLIAPLLAGLLAACAGDAAARQHHDLWPVPERYEVDARWAENELSGTMRLTLRNSGPEPLSEVWMRTWANAFGTCREPLATLDPAAGARAGCTARRVALDAPLAPGERATIALAFRVRVPAQEDRFGRFSGVAYLGSALPTLAVADADGWRLPPYFAQGEAWFSLAADWSVKLELPADLEAVATGTETTPGVHEARRARDFMIAIGRFRTRTLKAGDITLRHHRSSGVPVADARRTLGAAHAAIMAYQRWLGPYGREELDLVQGPRRGSRGLTAMEYPELVLTPAHPYVVAHEVAHQWWAFLMGNDPYREPFLDEGFAEYYTSRLPHSVTGGDLLRGCPRPKRPPRPPLSAGVPAFEKAGGRAYVRTVYTGTACMLRRLERGLGRRRFDRMMRRLVAARRDLTWTRADLIAAIRTAAPAGFDARAFLRREGVARD